MAMEQVNDLAYPRTGKRGVPQQFPRRLYNMLESEAQLQLERSDAESLIAWSETGKAFRIEDVTLFSTLVLPKYFRTNKFSSFQRNLNLYGFSKLRRGPDADMYAHPSFLRGRPEMLSQLKKCKVAADKKLQGDQTKRKTSSSEYLMSSSKEPIQPVPLMEGFTRAVSPSSGSDEDSFSRLKTIPRQCYGQTPRQQPALLDHVSHGMFRDHVSHSMSRRIQQQHQFACQNLLQAVTATKQPRISTRAESNGKLNLLTLAVTCLAESGTPRAL